MKIIVRESNGWYKCNAARLNRGKCIKGLTKIYFRWDLFSVIKHWFPSFSKNIIEQIDCGTTERQGEPKATYGPLFNGLGTLTIKGVEKGVRNENWE